MKQQCEHLDYNNRQDCEEEAEVMCMCCSVPLCSEHAGLGRCDYGGMGFIDIEN